MLTLDAALTVFLFNALPHIIVLNWLFMFLSAVGSFSLIWIILGILLIVMEEQKHREFIIFFLGGLIITALITSTFIKPIIHRERPVFANAIAKPVDYSFPSTHAATSFFAAALLTYYHKRKRVFFFTLAFLVAFSRLYLGVHYVGDVVAGAIIGVLVAYATSRFQFKIFNFHLDHGFCTITPKRGYTKRTGRFKKKR
jgi:undecaprenyl-diphosphatase